MFCSDRGHTGSHASLIIGRSDHKQFICFVPGKMYRVFYRGDRAGPDLGFRRALVSRGAPRLAARLRLGSMAAAMAGGTQRSLAAGGAGVDRWTNSLAMWMAGRWWASAAAAELAAEAGSGERGSSRARRWGSGPGRAKSGPAGLARRSGAGAVRWRRRVG